MVGNLKPKATSGASAQLHNKKKISTSQYVASRVKLDLRKEEHNSWGHISLLSVSVKFDKPLQVALILSIFCIEIGL